MTHYADATVQLHHGDCLDVLRTLPDASVDAIVTDPPYGLGFMGREWDSLPPGQPWAEQCLRVLKPGGHLLAFGGTRTSHRLACAIEDAGFEIRDSLCWLYGSGFPKSLDVSKAITATQRHGGANSVRIRQARLGEDYTPSGRAGNRDNLGTSENHLGTDPTRHVETTLTADAERWQGWGTALKPAHEPVVVARKPLGGTVAANVLTHGTGALNVDGCRVEGAKGWPDSKQYASGIAWGDNKDSAFTQDNSQNPSKGLGRWPANVILDESQAAALDEQSGERPGAVGMTQYGSGTSIGTTGIQRTERSTGGDATRDTGGASRYFYTAKAASSERIRVDGIAHPTVKPLSLMRWLVRLVTPPGGTVLEPFAGSGTTVEACILEGFRCIAIEREADYLPLITQRIHRRRDPVAYYRAAGGESSKSTSYGSMRKRLCNTCGNRTVPPSGAPWPACGHDDWEWIDQPQLAAQDDDNGLFDLLDGGAA